MKVLKDIAGSWCVVYPTGDPNIYLDCKKHLKLPQVTSVDIIKGGQMLWKVLVEDEKAPETIIEIARSMMK